MSNNTIIMGKLNAKFIIEIQGFLYITLKEVLESRIHKIYIIPCGSELHQLDLKLNVQIQINVILLSLFV